jgi:CpeS-like protein
MDITEFLQQSAGKWFSQRTSHFLIPQQPDPPEQSDPSKQSESGKSNLMIEIVPSTDPEVIKLCQQHQIEPALALCGARVNWDGTMEQDQKKQAGTTLLVPIRNAEQPSAGKLLRTGTAEQATIAGRYVIGSDDVMTLIVENKTLYSEERFWFASPNLRLRTSVLRQADGASAASFYSEIRMGGVQPPAGSATTSQANSSN